MIYKSFQATETKVLDPARGLVETVFSVTGNLDRQGDIIDPGAFTKALSAKASVPVVYAHKWDDLDAVLGKTISWRELLASDPGLPESLQRQGFGGVKAVVQFDQETPSGRVALTHVKNKNITEWSFAFDVDDDGEKTEGNVRHIKSIKEVYEVTLALIGANPATTTMAFKSMVEAAEYDEALEDLLEVAAQAIDETAIEYTTLPDGTHQSVSHAISPAKSNDEAITQVAMATILRDLSARPQTVPANASPLQDDEPNFDHFLTNPQQGVITRG